jgi:pimeloyl-ACP methyl ester carboxylesterase
MAPQYRSRGTAIALLAKDLMRERPAVFGITSTDVVFKAGIPFTLHQLPHLIADRIEERLPLIAARTLVIVGERDPIVPVEWARECADLANARLEVVDGAHVIMHSAPVEVARLMTEFAA